MCNIVVISVFWSLLYNEAIEDCKGDKWEIFNVYYAHIVPGASTFINFMISDAVLRRGHVKMVVGISRIYGYVNYIETLKRGKPLYWFLDWKDEKSIIIYSFLIFIFSLFWFALAYMTEIIKPRPN